MLVLCLAGKSVVNIWNVATGVLPLATVVTVLFARCHAGKLGCIVIIDATLHAIPVKSAQTILADIRLSLLVLAACE